MQYRLVVLFSLQLFLVNTGEAQENCNPLKNAFTSGWLSSYYTRPIVPNQSVLAKTKALEWISRIPKKILNKTDDALGMGTYELFAKKAPHAFDILKVNQSRNLPAIVNSFTFVNGSGNYSKLINVEYGICMGQTTAQRKFNILAFFDQDNSMAQILPPPKTAAWYKVIEGKIDKLLSDNKPQIFPGFKNTQELTTDPHLKHYVQKKIVDLWAEKNISLGGLKILSGVENKPTIVQAQNLYKTLQERLARNYSPIVYLAASKDSKFTKGHWIHVMQVHKLDPIQPDGSFTFYVWDVNYQARYPDLAVTVNRFGKMNYRDKELSKVGKVPWDDFEVGNMVENLLEFCNQHPVLCPQKKTDGLK